MKKFIFALLLLMPLLSCDEFSTLCNDQWSGSGGTVPDPFALATTPGDSVTVTAGTATFDMIYANNAASITFPSDNNDADLDYDDGIATINTKFFMGKTEVTYELWKTVYDWATDAARGANVYTFANAGIKGNDGAVGKSTQHPVTCINWRDAMVWCNALTEYCKANGGNMDCVYYTDSAYTTPIRSVDNSPTITTTPEGTEDNPYINPNAKGFRLPTSMEWEYAARYRTDSTNTVAGYSNPYFTKGNSASGATTSYNDIAGAPNYAGKLANDKVAVYRYYMGGSGYEDYLTSSTAEVMSKGAAGANSLGLYDMSGNVLEYCFDWHPGHVGSNRVLRGGAFNGYASALRVSSVPYCHPAYGYEDYGFRFVRTQ